MDLEEFGSRGLKGDRCHLALLPRSLNERNGEEEKERDKEKEREREETTRCSPRTRMLTRMSMVQMSKHMGMQSRRTLFCNSLFEQSCTLYIFPLLPVCSVECGVKHVECKV